MGCRRLYRESYSQGFGTGRGESVAQRCDCSASARWRTAVGPVSVTQWLGWMMIDRNPLGRRNRRLSLFIPTQTYGTALAFTFSCNDRTVVLYRAVSRPFKL